jgi:two-component system sensor histidine kinase RstB
MYNPMMQILTTTSGNRALMAAIVQAFLILALSAGISQIVLFPLVEDLALYSVQRWEVEYLSGGTIELTAAQLNQQPAELRAEKLNQISHLFGFDLELKTFDELELDKKQKRRLKEQGILGDPKHYTAYKVLKNNSQVLVFKEIKNSSKHLISEAQRTHMGTLAVLEGLLLQQPQNEWKGTINKLAESYPYPIALLRMDELDLQEEQLAELQANTIVTVETEQSKQADYPADMAYKQVADHVLVIGPISPPVLQRFYPILMIYYLLLSIIILLPLVVWLIPTWRSMNQLSRDTETFGQGEFKIRAQPIRGSKVNYLISVFNQMAVKIESLVESNKSLVNAVSHELRTPISRIEFNIELARESSDLKERNRHLNHIETSIDEMKTLVSEMLLYARFDQERPHFDMETVNLYEWLNGEVENWRSNQFNIDIELAMADKTITALVDRYYMSRAVSNLISNGLRYAKSQILVSALKQANSLILTIADDGPGIDYAERDKIFEPFSRLDTSRNRKVGGSGLGLAIVKQIIGWHHGQVWVEECPSGGAKFILQWPADHQGDS